MDDLDGVWEKSGDGVEGFDRPLGAAGKIENERSAADGGDSAGEYGTFSVLEAFAAHLFGHAGDEFFGDGLGGFGCGVARTESSAAGGENQVGGLGVGEFTEERLDSCGIVGESVGRNDTPAERIAAGDHRGAGGVLTGAIGYGVADGDDGDFPGGMFSQKTKERK